MQEILKSEYARFRSVLYHFFSQLMFQEPNRKSLEWMLNETSFESLKDIFSNNPHIEDFIEGLKQLEFNTQMEEKLMIDYQNLFQIPGEQYMFPYESCYLEKGIDGARGFVMGETTKKVSNLYKRAGVTFKSKEIDDFIAMEFLFMHFLSTREAKLLEQNKYEAASYYQDWQIGFLKEHLLCWIDEFFQEMKEKATTSFYQGVACLAEDFINEEREYLREYDN